MQFTLVPQADENVQIPNLDASSLSDLFDCSKIPELAFQQMKAVLNAMDQGQISA